MLPQMSFLGPPSVLRRGAPKVWFFLILEVFGVVYLFLVLIEFISWKAIWFYSFNFVKLYANYCSQFPGNASIVSHKAQTWCGTSFDCRSNRETQTKPMPPDNRVAAKLTDCLSDYCNLNNRTLGIVNDISLIRMMATCIALIWNLYTVFSQFSHRRWWET